MTERIIQILRGGEIKEHIEELGLFRIIVFREYPYLYDGDMQVERQYLDRYVRCDESILVVLRDQHGMLGACTGLPLKSDEDAFKAPFQGANLDEIFYIGEVMVRRDKRGTGIGSELLSTILRSIDKQRYKKTFLCAVDRGTSHPHRPLRYQSPDSLWEKYKFNRQQNATVYWPWKDVGDREETIKPMHVWIRENAERRNM